MPSKRMLFHDQARIKLRAGRDILADAVKVIHPREPAVAAPAGFAM